MTNGGKYVEQFEVNLTEYLGAPTLAFSSGTAALITMLRAANVEGGEVVCPSLTFPATPHSVVLSGARPVFADINPFTLTLDPNDVEKRITASTKAILGVDPFGICCDYESLRKLAHANGIYFLMDSAPAFGSLVDGVPTGRFADASIFSFHATKPFTTGGEGGALCSGNREIIEAAIKIRNFGLEGPDGDCRHVGLNGKMLEVCALIGLRQLESWKEVSDKRRKMGAQLHAALSRQVPVASIWTYVPIIVNDPKKRDAVIESLSAKGIGARRYYPACHRLACYREHWSNFLPVTEDIASRVVALPLYNDMTEDEESYIADAVKKCVS